MRKSKTSRTAQGAGAAKEGKIEISEFIGNVLTKEAIILNKRFEEMEARLNAAVQRVNNLRKASKENKKKLKAVVFTPPRVVEKMVKTIPQDEWKRPTHTILDPCAGFGNFTLGMLKHTQEEQDYDHFLQERMYMVEIDGEMAEEIENIFNPEGKLQLNIFVGDFIPNKKDRIEATAFFALPKVQRAWLFPQHCTKTFLNSIIILGKGHEKSDETEQKSSLNKTA